MTDAGDPRPCGRGVHSRALACALGAWGWGGLAMTTPPARGTKPIKLKKISVVSIDRGCSSRAYIFIA